MVGHRRRTAAFTALAVAAPGCCLGLGGATVARAAEPTTQELMEQVKALQAKVERLEQAQQQQEQQRQARQAQAGRAEEGATADRVLADADRRSQLLQTSGNFTAGYSKGKFLIQDEKGDFVFHPWLQFKPRFVANYREGGKNGGNSDDSESGFEVRRMKFGFDGNVFTPDLTYLFLWATDRNSGNPVLEEAWARYKCGDFAVKGGQLKDPFAHEALTSSKRLLAAERTILTDLFTGGEGFTQGVTLAYETGGPVRAEVAYTDGNNQPNRTFQDFPTSGINANFGAAGRIEWKAFGKWGEYDDFTTLGNDQDLLVFGGGVDLTQAGTTNVLLHTADVQYEVGRLGLFAAYYGRYTDDAAVGTGGAAATRANLYDYGGIVQAAYLLPDDHWEPFVRADYIHFDGEGLAAGSENEVYEFTVGANYYLRGHSAKVTVDFTWLPNGTPVADNGADVLANDGRNEYLLRAQFQLLL
jgi:outer membrane murein-binding lipoprotein Lpp